MPDYTVKADVDSMLRADNDAGIRSAIGLGQTDAPTFLAQTLTGQSLTGTQATSLVDLATTWNTSGTPTAIKLNVVETGINSNAASLLMDLQVGGSTKVNVRKNGTVYTSSVFTSPVGFNISSNQDSGNQSAYFTSAALALPSGANIGFTNVTNGFGTLTTILARDADHIIAQRNGVNKQALRVYNTNLSGAPEWAEFDWITSGTGNTLRIGTNKSGDGVARPIDFVTGGVVRMSIAAAGEVTINGLPVGKGGGNVLANIAIGLGALSVNTSGTDNVAIGYQVMNTSTAAFESVGIGYQAIKSGSNSRHVAVGYGAATNGGSDGVDIGWAASFSRTTGSLNVVIGRNAGRMKTNGGVANLTSISNSVLIGSDVKALDNGDTNEIVIGFEAIGIGSNSVVLGNDSITKTALKGNVGIGTTNPASKLTVTNGDVEVATIASGLILKSPDGTRYRVTVPNGGTVLTITAV